MARNQKKEREREREKKKLICFSRRLALWFVVVVYQEAGLYRGHVDDQKQLPPSMRPTASTYLVMVSE